MKVVLIVAVAGVLGLAVVKDNVFSESDDSIQVTGHVEVPMKADTAEVNLGVLTISAPTQEQAVKETSAKMAAVTKAIQEGGVTPEQFQLTGYAINPRYKDAQAFDETGKPTGGAAEIIAYTASQQVTVRVPKIDEDAGAIDRVILAAAKEGANQVGEVRLFVGDLEEAKQAARIAAIKDARSKAKAAASAAEVKLKGVGSWYENVISNGPGSSTPTPGSYYGMPATPSGTLTGPAGTANLGAGNLMLVVEINVTFNVENKRR